MLFGVFRGQSWAVIHILGAGIAGLMLAAALDRRRKSWRLYEKEPKAGLHASGKNAGIIRTYEADPVMRHFAAQSLGYYRTSEPSYNECGILLRPWEVDYSAPEAERRPFAHGRFEGLFLPDNGTIEPGDLMLNLAGADFQHGSILYNFDAQPEADAERIVKLLNGNADGIALPQGDILVCACGEGAIDIAARLSRPLGLIAHRRTLYEFRNETHYSGPVEWDEESGVYYRTVGDHLLATAGEQVPVAGDAESEEPGIASQSLADAKMLAVLARENPRLRPDLLVSTRTCKRLMPLDNRPYAGRDAIIENLFWFTGLGGRGISTAPALAESLAAVICGESSEENLAAVSPARIS